MRGLREHTVLFGRYTFAILSVVGYDSIRQRQSILKPK